VNLMLNSVFSMADAIVDRAGAVRPSRSASGPQSVLLSFGSSDQGSIRRRNATQTASKGKMLLPSTGVPPN
jgi:hypothetical protein